MGKYSLSDIPPLPSLLIELRTPEHLPPTFVEGKDSKEKLSQVRRETELTQDDLELLRLVTHYVREIQWIEFANDLPDGLPRNKQPWFRPMFWDAYLEGRAEAFDKQQREVTSNHGGTK